MIAAAVVAIGLVLSILTVPSGFQQTTTPTPPPATAPATTTPRPGENRPGFPLPTGTWIGLISEGVPPRTLTGTFPFLDPAEDVLPDGSLITRTSDAYVLVGPDGLHTDLPIGSPSDLVDVALSPNGRLLATVDRTGHVSIWDVVVGGSTDLESVTFPEPVKRATIRWAPDSASLGLDVSGEHFSIWTTDGPAIYGPADGRLLAIATNVAAVQNSDGFRLQSLDGGFTSRPGFSEITSVAFDPSGRYFAIDANVTSESQSGVWILARDGLDSTQVAPPDSVFAWSGDGSALYWADASGTYAHPVGSEYSAITVSGIGARQDDRLRVYDSALVAKPTSLVRSGDIYELRGDRIYRRTSGSVTELATSPGETSSILNGFALDPTAPLVRSAKYPEAASTVSLVDRTGGTARLLATLPTESLYASSVIAVPDMGTFIATDDGQILEVGSDQTTTHVVDGHSPGTVGTTTTVPFAVTDAAIVRLRRGAATVTYTSGGAEDSTRLDVGEPPPEVLVNVDDLAGAAAIVDAIGVRTDLLVLVRTRVGSPAIYWIPGDSELLNNQVIPDSPMPNPTPFSQIATPFDTMVVGTARFIEADDGQTFAVEIHSGDLVKTILMADPAPDRPTCGGAVVCDIGSTTGRALAFSPDGAWLLTDDEGVYSALSTRGRGIATFGEGPPDQVVWLP
jgi:WD40 repeat protein